MDDLTGRTAFITGAASGIGLGIARALAAEGVKLALADLDGESLAHAVDELQPTTDVVGIELDVRDRAAFAAAAARVERELGTVTLLFNNAGVASPTRIPELRYELWDFVLGVDLGGVVNGVQTFLPRMLEHAAGGYIVNTASAAGLVVGPGVGYLYHTAKYAVVGLSEALQVELAPHGIGVSVLCPGAVASNILDNTDRFHAVAVGPTELSDTARARREIGRQILAQGTTPDVVGSEVVAAMRRGQLFIQTDPYAADAIEARHQAIMASVSSKR